MARHTIVVDELDTAGGVVEIAGEEAAHAVRVKRLRTGETVRLMDDRGNACLARVVEARKTLVVEIEAEERIEAVRPRLHVCSAAPKGNRLDKMIDMLGQVGVSSWRLLETANGVVEPGANKMERMERIARETVKQALRPGPMEIASPVSVAGAIDLAGELGARLAVLDAGGGSWSVHADTDDIVLLVGPEGGFRTEELTTIGEAGAAFVSLGPTVLRIETAAVVGAGVLLAAERAARAATDR